MVLTFKINKFKISKDLHIFPKIIKTLKNAADFKGKFMYKEAVYFTGYTLNKSLNINEVQKQNET